MEVREVLLDPLVCAETRIAAVLQHSSTSYWLKDALSRALDRDPVDAVDDAVALEKLLEQRISAIFDRLLVDPDVGAALRR